MINKKLVSIILVILTLSILFLLNKDKLVISEDQLFQNLVNEFLHKDFYGVVKDKYIDVNDHLYKKVIIVNKSHSQDVLILNFERNDFFEFIQIGDTLLKKSNSLHLNLKRENLDTIMHFKFENHIYQTKTVINYKKDSLKSENPNKTAYQVYKESLTQLKQIIESSKPYDHSDGFEAVAYLTEISGYEGGGDHNYFGTFGFKDEDLKYWKEWFIVNKDSLDYIYVPESYFHYDK